MVRLRGFLVLLVTLASPAAAQTAADFSDNADSVAVVIGNENYRHVGKVDYALRDAEAIRDYLRKALHFENVRVVNDATKSELEHWFGTQEDLHGELWNEAQERSNIFVYYSGHGVPASSGSAFLLATDTYPDELTPGYPLELLYRSLEEVKLKIGAGRLVLVMLDACFTGETGPKGQNAF